LGVGCSRPAKSAPTITIEHTVLPEPPLVGPATLTLRLADASAKPVSGARIGLEADMSHAGMAPLFAEVKEIEPGQYQAHLSFEMAGDWVILLHVRLAGGQTLEHQFNVASVRPN
jgi:YtkA-like